MRTLKPCRRFWRRYYSKTCFNGSYLIVQSQGIRENGRSLGQIRRFGTQCDRNDHNESRSDFHWKCAKTWREAGINTSWCLLGCSIGDFGTIAIASAYFPMVNPIAIMAIATINGLGTSILLETAILFHRNKERGMTIGTALSTALGMSLISMLSMETASMCLHSIVKQE